MIMEWIAHCPSEFTLHARNPAHDLHFGGNNLIFRPDGVPPPPARISTMAADPATRPISAIS